MSETQLNGSGDHLDFAGKKTDACSAVWRLLHYAISDADIDLNKENPQLVRKVVPVLQKAPENMTEGDVSDLLQAYNQLSQLVYPATNESLRLKEKIEEDERSLIEGKTGPYSAINKQVKNSYTNFWVALWMVILVFIVYQSYIYFISDTLHVVSENVLALKTLDEKINAAKAASNDPDKNRGSLENKYPFNDLYAQRQVIWLQLNSSYCVLQGVSLLWIRWYPGDGIVCGANKGKPENTYGAVVSNFLLKQCQDKSGPDKSMCEQEARETQELAVRNNFFAGAKAVLRISNYLVLPTLLGLLGSLAYVIRGILDSFSKFSFRLSSRRRWGMRVALGPLLGLISGIVIAPDITEFKELSFSPLVWGFLMGYSVEFAFSVFDFLIAKGRSAIGSTNIKLEDKGQGDAKNSPDTSKAPARGPNANGKDALTIGNESSDGNVDNLAEVERAEKAI